jgi:hypothetical protein
MRHFGPLIIYPRNSAMHGCWELACFEGYLCVFPPVYAFGVWRRCHAYWSPNATPWHHGMRPLFRTNRPLSCVCGEPECPCPPQPAFPEKEHTP